MRNRMTGVQYKQPYKKIDETKSKKFCLSRKPWYVKMCIGVTSVLVLGFACVVAIFASTNPIHASCSVQWTFGLECSAVNTRLVNQIKLWNGPDGCKKGGEKCLYKLVSNSDNKLTATHETPTKHYKDDLTFTFTPSGNTCNLKGHSTSETWYAVLDYGTNYCNLHNLITGSGLNNTQSYSETTSDSQCTQYSSANCDKY